MLYHITCVMLCYITCYAIQHMYVIQHMLYQIWYVMLHNMLCYTTNVI